MLVARLRQRSADAGQPICLTPIDTIGQRRANEAQQRAQPLEAAARVVDGGGRLVAPGEARLSNVDLLEADATDAPGDGLGDLQSIDHGRNNSGGLQIAKFVTWFAA